MTINDKRGIHREFGIGPRMRIRDTQTGETHEGVIIGFDNHRIYMATQEGGATQTAEIDYDHIGERKVLGPSDISSPGLSGSHLGTTYTAQWTQKRRFRRDRELTTTGPLQGVSHEAVIIGDQTIPYHSLRSQLQQARVAQPRTNLAEVLYAPSTGHSHEKRRNAIAAYLAQQA